MINIENKEECCGCWACENICPRECIEMKIDDEGFHYPLVNQDKCVDCGLCEKVCPLNKPCQDDIFPKSYVVQQQDKKILQTSTSGGFYTSIAKYVISKGGVVFGAAFDKDMVLRHSYAENLEDCVKYRGSKYVQSLIGHTYKQAKEFLKERRLVAFSGTPCQIAGLLDFLGKKYENLITVDLVCHGTPSPLLFKKYLAFHEEKMEAKAINYLSRDKYYGYDYSTANITFDNSDIHYHRGKESDLMLRLYFKDICSRPSCYACHFKTINRVSDITIFDCWDAPSVSPQFSKDGATNVFIHSSLGMSVFNDIKSDFIYSPSDIESIINRDGIMIKNRVVQNPLRTEFFKDLNSLDIAAVESKYLDCGVKFRLISIIKPFMYKLGVFSIYMKLKNK